MCRAAAIAQTVLQEGSERPSSIRASEAILRAARRARRSWEIPRWRRIIALFRRRDPRLARSRAAPASGRAATAFRRAGLKRVSPRWHRAVAAARDSLPAWARPLGMHGSRARKGMFAVPATPISLSARAWVLARAGAPWGPEG